MRKTTSARRPDVILENDEEKRLWIIDIACPSEWNIGEEHRESLINISNWHLRYERENRSIELK